MYSIDSTIDAAAAHSLRVIRRERRKKALAKFREIHPDVAGARVSSMTGRNVYIRYHIPELRAFGLFVVTV